MAHPIPLENLPVYERNHPEFPGSASLTQGAIIPVDKPAGWTSFDVVKYVRNRLPVRKTGHAGTLDPMATGLLVLCCGKATKSISQIQEKEKTYIAEITFGASTPSYDADTGITETRPWDHLTKELLKTAVENRFTGEIEQIPPVYSALWKDGQRMYKLARKGIKVDPEPRRVILHDVEFLEINFPVIKISIRCGKGFYVRSLAVDLAKEVGTLGYLSSLRRTAIGEFGVDGAWTMDQVNEWSSDG